LKLIFCYLFGCIQNSEDCLLQVYCTRVFLWEVKFKVVYIKYWLEDGSLEPKHVGNYVLMTIYVSFD